MRAKNPKIQISEFVELVALPSKLASNHIFDLIIEEEININNYCAALVDKICILKNTSYSNFIDYQCLQIINPILFLEMFEELIINNEKFLESNCAKIKILSLFNLLVKKRIELQSTTLKKLKTKIQDKHINANSEDRIFSFYDLLKKLEKFKTDSEKIIMLT